MVSFPKFVISWSFKFTPPVLKLQITARLFRTEAGRYTETWRLLFDGRWRIAKQIYCSLIFDNVGCLVLLPSWKVSIFNRHQNKLTKEHFTAWLYLVSSENLTRVEIPALLSISCFVGLHVKRSLFRSLIM